MSWIFRPYPIPRETIDGQEKIWDIVRKRWFVSQPEEEVRQHVLHFLAQDKGIPLSRIGVEKEIRYQQLRKRFDIVVFDRSGKPFLLIECKAPEVPINQNTLNQIARYNVNLQAPHLLLTNGHQWLVFSLQADGTYQHQESGWYE
ncbi:MAG: type I restriction enzyme HsdR N-terminal domain-containing protein [Bacteroidota bacterium]